MLQTLVALLAAITIAVPLSRRPGSAASSAISSPASPSARRAAPDHRCRADRRMSPALGVIMLLFLIGLEVRPQRLWVHAPRGLRPRARRRW